MSPIEVMNILQVRPTFYDLLNQNINFSESLNRLKQAKVDNIQEITASQIDILNKYYEIALFQSQRSFRLAWISAVVGLIFFIFAAGFLLIQLPQSLALVTSLGGALSGFISGINFVLYNKSTLQLNGFHDKLFLTQKICPCK